MKKKAKKIKRTSDGIRIGTVMKLVRVEDDGVNELFPAEMGWMKQWVVTKITDETHITLRNKLLRRDINVFRPGSMPFNELTFMPTAGESGRLRFKPTKETAFLVPEMAKYKPKTTTVALNTSTALDFVRRWTGMSLVNMINDAVNNTASKIVNDLAKNSLVTYYRKTGLIPEYLPVFNSIVSSDIAFLEHIREEQGGQVNKEQMRWIAFDGDELTYRPEYAAH